ncbi:MAG: primosomal protein N' (replication factor Y) [Moritella sp.]|jgi:primosomal protein N' (replication factor Y)
MPVVAVAVPIHLRRTFDYFYSDNEDISPGMRICVPFMNKQLVGVAVAVKHSSDFPLAKLKPIIKVLDENAILTEEMLSFFTWSADYYHYPIGEVIAQALPVLLRKQESAQLSSYTFWQLTEAGHDLTAPEHNRLTPAQQQTITLLATTGLTQSHLKLENIKSTTINALQGKGLVKSQYIKMSDNDEQHWRQNLSVSDNRPQLNIEQAVTIAAINTNMFATYLLDGVTGSGKTEVYLNVIEKVLKGGKQALVIVPEIGLTPQTISRFKKRFNVPIVALHSGLNDAERREAWLEAQAGIAGIVIGTRSAIFTPMQDLGVIIIDEEHDGSLKQQETLRYHARDLAIVRAQRNNIPVVLGSATPALESLYNAMTGKYHYLQLTQRAGNALMPGHHLIDIKNKPLNSGLSAELLTLMAEHLAAGNQVLLFLNRRGYAPAVMCHSCGSMAECQRCNTYYTYHQARNSLHCHHCDEQYPKPKRCPSCNSSEIMTAGFGTEQLEGMLSAHFPDYPIIRIDRDSTSRKGSLEKSLEAVRKREFRILIGTQMLAKGHHFPDVTLVGLIDVDSALFSTDFRASEKLAQLFIQVSGRAGRAAKPGKVAIQTHHPDHELIQDLVNNGYAHFAQNALQARAMANLPPYSFQALFRAEAHQFSDTNEFLTDIKQLVRQHSGNAQLLCLGPMPAPMEKRAGKYRLQLLLQSSQRQHITQLLRQIMPQIEGLKSARKARWSLDVDPTEML